MKKKIKKFCFTPLTALLRHPLKKSALIKKIFLQALVEIIFRYHKIFFRVLGPPGPPYEQNENFYMRGHGYQN